MTWWWLLPNILGQARASYQYVFNALLGDWTEHRNSCGSAACTNVPSSVTSTLALGVNSARLGALFVNDSASDCFLKYGPTASATSYSVYLAPKGQHELPQPVYQGRIDVIWASANGALRVTELT